MTRHARNCTAGAVYTYHERKKDAEESGYGTERQRIGKESVRDFDCCCLSLHPCRNPVVTPDGYLFDKEAILEYVIAKKNEISRKEKEYKKQLSQDKIEQAELAAIAQREKIRKFTKTEDNLSLEEFNEVVTDSVSNMAKGREKQLPCFWVPSQSPDAKKTKLKKPDKTVYCPLSGKPLKINELVNVKFKKMNEDDKNDVTKNDRYVCAVTGDVLSNAVPAAVIRTTGDVVTAECVEKIIKKDWLHPLSGEKLTEKDIIYLQRGGTGYAMTNSNLEVKNPRPTLQ